MQMLPKIRPVGRKQHKYLKGKRQNWSFSNFNFWYRRFTTQTILKFWLVEILSKLDVNLKQLDAVWHYNISYYYVTWMLISYYSASKIV